MRTRIFIPALPRMTGGLAVLYRMAADLHANGYDVALVLRDGQAPGLDPQAPPAPCMTWDALDLAPKDIWLVPEGWGNALAPGLRAGARNVVYVQNWAYLLSGLPQGVHWPQLDVSFLAVSDPVRWFTQQVTGRDAPVLRPGIDLSLFHPPAGRDDAAPLSPGEPVRVAWMPRKNKALALQIRAVLEARLALPDAGLPLPESGARQPEAAVGLPEAGLAPSGIRMPLSSSVAGLPEAAVGQPGSGVLPRVEWVEIHGRTQAEVAELLRSAHVFLATGFPEGCPLPPLEALASGCLLTGFGGTGGWDYMRQALPGGYAPWWPLRPVPWGNNGLFASDADVVGAAFALERAVRLIHAGGRELAAIRGEGRTTAAAYASQKQCSDLLALWRRAARGELFTTSLRA